MQNALYLRFKEHRDNFEQNYTISKETAEKEAIHDLRVSVKKMRAISLVLKKADVPKKIIKKTIKPLKPVFKKAGNIREPQVFYELSVEVPDHTVEILNDIKEQENKAIKKFHKEIGRFDLPVWIKSCTQVLSVINELSEEEIINSAESIISKKNNKIEKLISSPKKKYHKIRKQFKVNQEVLLILREIKKKPILTDQRDIVKDMGSLLGDWHDLKELNELTIKMIKKNQLDIQTSKFAGNVKIRQAKLENQIDDILSKEQVLESI